MFEVITFMERAEDWTLDGDPQIEAALEKLEMAMSELQGIEISNFEQLVYIGAYLKTSRVLKIMQEMDTNNPEQLHDFLVTRNLLMKQQSCQTFYSTQPHLRTPATHQSNL